MANLVIYYGIIIVEVREAFRATVVCSILNANGESTSYINATYTIRTIKTHLCCNLYIFCTYISAKYVLCLLRGEVSTDSTAVKMATDTHTQAD